MAKEKDMYLETYKRYVLTIIILLSVFLIGYISYTAYKAIQNTRFTSSYLVKRGLAKEYYIEEDLSDIKNLSGDYFMYITYTGSEENYQFEKDIKSLIQQYNLKDKFYLINIDSLVDSNNEIDAVNGLLGLEEFKVTKLPTIIYVNKDNQITRNNIITRIDDNHIEKGDFQKLLDINGF